MLFLVFGPILAGVILAFVQMLIYAGVRKVSGNKELDTPIFPILLMRGLFVTLGIIAILAVYSTATKEGLDPMLPQWIHEQAERQRLEEAVEENQGPIPARDTGTNESTKEGDE